MKYYIVKKYKGIYKEQPTATDMSKEMLDIVANLKVGGRICAKELETLVASEEEIKHEDIIKELSEKEVQEYMNETIPERKELALDGFEVITMNAVPKIADLSARKWK